MGGLVPPKVRSAALSRGPPSCVKGRVGGSAQTPFARIRRPPNHRPPDRVPAHLSTRALAPFRGTAEGDQGCRGVAREASSQGRNSGTPDGRLPLRPRPAVPQTARSAGHGSLESTRRSGPSSAPSAEPEIGPQNRPARTPPRTAQRPSPQASNRPADHASDLHLRTRNRPPEQTGSNPSADRPKTLPAGLESTRRSRPRSAPQRNPKNGPGTARPNPSGDRPKTLPAGRRSEAPKTPIRAGAQPAATAPLRRRAQWMNQRPRGRRSSSNASIAMKLNQSAWRPQPPRAAPRGSSAARPRARGRARPRRRGPR